MQSLKLTRAAILAFTTAAAIATGAYALADPADKGASAQNEATDQHMMGDMSMKDHMAMMKGMKEMMAHCRTMHERMHAEMMDEEGSPEPEGELQQQENQGR